MAKYRLLTIEELKALEKEFVDYLVANGIPADEWEKIKVKDPDAADRIVDLFSDVIMEGVLRKTKYVEHYTKNRVLTFFFDESEVTMISMSCDNIDTDFTNQDYIAFAASDPPDNLKMGKQTKSYIKERSEEIWDLIEQGCTVSEGKLYLALEESL